MEAKSYDAYENREKAEPRHEQTAVDLRSFECEVISDDRAYLSGRYAGRMKRPNGVHVRP